eukprot:m.195017 g.195017  ORF g.195017 m.195017 type:complete len:310 (-) comp18675_c0_seq2:416-1345(-)
MSQFYRQYVAVVLLLTLWNFVGWTSGTTPAQCIQAGEACARTTVHVNPTTIPTVSATHSTAFSTPSSSTQCCAGSTCNVATGTCCLDGIANCSKCAPASEGGCALSYCASGFYSIDGISRAPYCFPRLTDGTRCLDQDNNNYNDACVSGICWNRCCKRGVASSCRGCGAHGQCTTTSSADGITVKHNSTERTAAGIIGGITFFAVLCIFIYQAEKRGWLEQSPFKKRHRADTVAMGTVSGSSDANGAAHSQSLKEAAAAARGKRRSVKETDQYLTVSSVRHVNVFELARVPSFRVCWKILGPFSCVELT